MTEPQNPSGETTTWREVLSTDNMAEAHIIAGRLEYEGLHPRVHQEPLGSALGLTVGMLGEVLVLVPEAEFEAAQRLLDDDSGDDDYDDDTFELDEDDFE